MEQTIKNVRQCVDWNFLDLPMETLKKLTKKRTSLLRDVIKQEKSFKLCHKHFWCISRVCLVTFYFIKMSHSKLLSSFLQNFSVVFAVANNSAVSIRLSIVNNQNFFLVSCPVLANCKITGFSSLLRNIGIYIYSKFCENFSNTHLRAIAKLCRPNLTAVNYSLLRVRESVTIFAHLLGHIQRA